MPYGEGWREAPREEYGMKPVAQGVKRAELEMGLQCPDCGGGLLVSSLQDAFTLICACGRQVHIDEIEGAEGTIAVLEAVLRAWETQLDALRDLSIHARLDGFASISELFNRRIRRIEVRIELLRHAARN